MFPVFASSDFVDVEVKIHIKLKIWPYLRVHIYACMFVEVVRSKVEGFVESLTSSGGNKIPPYRSLSTLSLTFMSMSTLPVVVGVGKEGCTLIGT